MALYIGEDDPPARRILESILETEEEHADDLKQLLEDHAGTRSV
jgi:bacterioferritin (cytochrome b1)